MSKLFIHMLDAEQIAALKNVGHTLEGTAISAGQHVVAAIKASPEGEKILDAIHTIKDSKLTGIEKFEHVVLTDALPLVEQFVTSGGATLVADAESTAREVVQSLFNDTLGKLAA